MNKGFVITGLMMSLLLVLFITTNYLIISKNTQNEVNPVLMKIDAVKNRDIDVQRIIQDAVQDGLKDGVNCTDKFDRISLYLPAALSSPLLHDEIGLTENHMVSNNCDVYNQIRVTGKVALSREEPKVTKSFSYEYTFSITP